MNNSIENPGINGLKVIIVEDEIIIAKDIKQTLEKAGCEVLRMFMSGEEAAKKIPSLGADIVLMDVFLKGRLDGIEVAEIISLSVNLPIVFITGHTEQSIISRINFTDNFGIVLKPFNTNTLLTSVELAYRNHKKKNRSVSKSDGKLDTMLCLLKDINSDFRPQSGSSRIENSKNISLSGNLAALYEAPFYSQEYKSSIMTMINYADHILNDYDSLTVDEIKRFAAKISVCLKMLYSD